MVRQGLTQPGVRIDDRLWNEFRQDVEDRYGTVRGHLRHELENALREYVNASAGGDTHDRLRRIEQAVESIDDRLDAQTPVAESGKKKKDSGVSATRQNRLDKIEAVINQESGPGPVHEAVVRKAIEDVAGHSDPTIRRYTQMLTDRGVLHPHPRSDSRYVYGDRDFAVLCEQLFERGNITADFYFDVAVDRVGGSDEWDQLLDEAGVGDPPEDRTFQ